MDPFQARNRMVEAQIARRGVRDLRVLAAMRIVPRELFIAAQFKTLAYEDGPLPIAEGQSISQPYIVAAMLEAAELADDDKVLEVGAGSGYVTALLGRVADQVFAVERHAALTEAARERLRVLGYDNVKLRTADGSGGWPEAAPFDAIIVSAGAPGIPRALKEQLAIGGRLVMPVGPPDEQKLTRVLRLGQDDFATNDLGAVRFVKLIGAEGWKDTTEAPPRRVGNIARTDDGTMKPRGRCDDEPFEGLPMPTQKDAIALLKADHRKVEELFEKYENARSKKADIAKKICMELTIHIMIEEEIFYPACRKAGVESDMMDEANVEHDGAKSLIAELEAGTPDDDFYDAKVKVLSEEIKHHVKEEEQRGGIFTQAREAEMDLAGLGEKMAARKEELMAQFEAKGLPAPVTRTMKAPPLEQASA